MIAEIPAPGCSKAEALLVLPRREFVDLFGRVPLSWSWSEPRTSENLVEPESGVKNSHFRPESGLWCAVHGARPLGGGRRRED
jgi:hypothetical protein